jgi:hypothetical protein
MSYSCQQAYIDFQKIVTEMIKIRREEFVSNKKDMDKEVMKKEDKEKVKIMGYILRLKLLEDVGINVSKFIAFNKRSNRILNFISQNSWLSKMRNSILLREYAESGNYEPLLKSYKLFDRKGTNT